ncbi:MAG: hypothetical protein HY901_05190, partial [Deltaproteobacteria bacterium]|nr:hypothetical protein [Deltaproteobacteria bacterium]
MTATIVRLVQAILARRRLVLVAGLLLGLVCLPFAVQLYRNLRSAIEELLP